MKFELGEVVITRGLAESGINHDVLRELVIRHSKGDWGDLSEEDKELNDEAVETGEDRIFSSYMIDGKKIYVITEWDRSVTTIMFADEY